MLSYNEVSSPPNEILEAHHRGAQGIVRQRNVDYHRPSYRLLPQQEAIPRTDNPFAVSLAQELSPALQKLEPWERSSVREINCTVSQLAND